MQNYHNCTAFMFVLGSVLSSNNLILSVLKLEQGTKGEDRLSATFCCW